MRPGTESRENTKSEASESHPRRRKGRAVSKDHTNVFDQGFVIRFVERLQDGSPRWLTPEDGYAYVDQLADDPKKVLDCDDEVWKAVHGAHDHRYEGLDVLETCVNPDCVQRVQEYHRAGYPAAWQDCYREMATLARGSYLKLANSCQTCQAKRYYFPCGAIRDKWVYVLLDAGETLIPFQEVHVQKSRVGPKAGTIYYAYDPGRKRFRNDKHEDFEGFLPALPGVWHYFLSPVRLGPRALDLLIHAPGSDADRMAARQKFAETHWHGFVAPHLQPWTTTVKRTIPRVVLGLPLPPLIEFVPLVDPFLWVDTMTGWDYLPIAKAQQILLSDPNEQAKAFVASTLSSSMARKLSDGDPPRWVDDDRFELSSCLEPPPKSLLKSGNAAKAWTDRYEERLSYLTAQVNRACWRIEATVRFSRAHRIVELACQERGEAAGFLSHGLLHWFAILKEILLCRAGQVFIKWLLESPDAADFIPARNLIGKENLGPGSKVHGEAGGLAVQALMPMLPFIISRSSDPTEEVTEHLQKFGVEVTTVKAEGISADSGGLKNFMKVLKDPVVAISNSVLNKYSDTMPGSLGAGIRRAGGEQVLPEQWKLRGGSMLESADDLLDLAGLLLGLEDFTKSPKPFDTPYGHYGQIKKVYEYPFKLLDFMAKQGRNYIQCGLAGDAEQIVKAIEKKGVATLITAEEARVLQASRSLRTYGMLWRAGKFLSGPVGLILGSVDYLLAASGAVAEWESGDPGAAAGQTLQAAGAALGIGLSVADTVAWITGATVEFGPVGWIAALLVIAGTIVFAYCRKTDLQKFAQHCWLGKEYGSGDEATGFAWMGKESWSSLRNNEDRFQRQQTALLRLLSGFEVITHTWGPTWGAEIYPAYLGDSAHFEIEVDVWPRGGVRATAEHFQAIIWPNAREWAWIGTKPASEGKNAVEFDPPAPPGRVGQVKVRAKPNHFTADYYDWEIRVRLCLDGSLHEFANGSQYLPVAGWVVNAPDRFMRKRSSEVG